MLKIKNQTKGDDSGGGGGIGRWREGDSGGDIDRGEMVVEVECVAMVVATVVVEGWRCSLP